MSSTTGIKLQDGDRTMEMNGEETVVTPKKPDCLCNFGPASARDTVLFTCERPGGDPPGNCKLDTKRVVEEWVRAISKHKIQHVFVLLGEDELLDYQPPGLLEAYKSASPELNVHHTPFSKEGSFDLIMTKLGEIERREERAVAHCTHGMGRSGRVAAGWLVYRYKLTPEEATEEALATARQHGVERMGALKALTKWVNSSSDQK